jgi:O-antigen ligase
VLIVGPSGRRWRLSIAGLTSVLVLGSVAAMEMTSIGSGGIGAHATSAVQSRSEIFATTSRAVADFMPFGSGLGSFRTVYQLYENLAQVTPEYVVHAHNDYAEVALELGLAGILLMLAFLLWWLAAVWRAWWIPETSPFAKAAAIASAAVLVHSIVDFPLRTAAISACFGMCLALLADTTAAPPKEAKQLRQSRHVVVK